MALRWTLCALVAMPAMASFESRHAADVAANPPDLHFRFITKAGQHTFQIGERIPIILAFSSDTPAKYELNGATYDRSGRLFTEEFITEQNDIVDPYQDYFGTGVLGTIGGGLRTYPVLDSKPEEIELSLNDWFRFDHPGRYRLYLKSHRLKREDTSKAGAPRIQFAAVSNILEIEILPANADWTSAKLASIRAALMLGKPADESVRIALRELEAVGTPEAVSLAFEYSRRTDASPSALLLVAARDRPQVIAAFDQYLNDPHIGFREWDIRLRALFALVQNESPKPLSMWDPPEGAERDKLEATIKARNTRFETLVREQAVALIPLIAKKDMEVRDACAQAIARIALEAARAAGLVPPENYGLTREQLIAQFASFQPDRQAELLSDKWDLVRGPEMIPLLEALIRKATPKPIAPVITALAAWGGTSSFIDETALRRLMDLAPAKAERILKNDIASGKPIFPGFAVRELPAQDLPAADAALSLLLKSSYPGTLPLAAKFATKKLTTQMRELYEKEVNLPCMEQEWFLIYFLRTGSGRDMLHREMANREDRGCYRTLVGDVAARVWNADVEAEAIASLTDPEEAVVTVAAATLATFGEPEVEPLLWKRLERWSEQWRGRAAELYAAPIGKRRQNPQEPLGDALFYAIGYARSWLLTEPRRERLLSLCVGDACRERWGKPPDAVRVEASSGDGNYPVVFRVGGYAVGTFEGMKFKLQQYPAGTVVRRCTQSPGPFGGFTVMQQQDMFNDLSSFLAKRSITIEPYSEKCVPY